MTKRAFGLLLLLVFLAPQDLSAAEDIFSAVYKGDLGQVKQLIANGTEVDINNTPLGTPLMFASQHGRKTIVEFLLSKGADVNARDHFGRTPLIWASIHGHKDIAALLISKSANVNAGVHDARDKDEEGRTSLMFASMNGHRELVDFLIANGADVNVRSCDGQSALKVSIQTKHKEIAQVLISKGADIYEHYRREYSLLMLSIMHDLPEIARLLISLGSDVNITTNQGISPLSLAIQNGQDEIVKLLVAKDADINREGSYGTTPLLIALSSGRKNIADFLIKKGAIANIDARDLEGNTALMDAAQWGQLKAAELLIGRGADVNARDYNGRTPLMYTAMQGEKYVAEGADGKIPSEFYTELANRRQIVELLIKKGADVNAKDYDGKTALIFAAMSEVKEIAAFLISKGAYVDTADAQGDTPLGYALRNKNKDIQQLLAAGSKAPRRAKKISEAHKRSEADMELQKAKETLIRFFDYLHDGKYDKAVLLFEPWPKGPGMHRSSWEGFFSFLLREERNEQGKGKSLGIYYQSAGVPIKAKVLDARKVAENMYRLRVQFIQDDGAIYVYGPCCGATEETMPAEKVFAYFVKRIDGVYKVRTPPLFRP